MSHIEETGLNWNALFCIAHHRLLFLIHISVSLAAAKYFLLKYSQAVAAPDPTSTRVALANKQNCKNIDFKRGNKLNSKAIL